MLRLVVKFRDNIDKLAILLFLSDKLTNMISRTEYEQEKTQITSEVSRIMDLAIAPTLLDLDSQTKEFIKRLYEGRRNRAIQGGRLRDIVVKTTLNLCGIKDLHEEHLKVIAAGEFYNIASYYQNWHLDNKKEVKTENDKKLCHIASHLFREFAEQLILETKFKDSSKIRLLEELNQSNKAIQQGQALELNYLNTRNKEISDENIAELYKKRAYLLSGRFYGSSFCFGPIMAEMGEEIIAHFKTIGEWFGTGGQIINDVGDFCLNKQIAKNPEKDYQDQFSDLEKGTFTLPIYQLSKVVNLDKYAGRKLKTDEKSGLLKIMVNSKCFDSSRKITNEYRNKMIKKLKAAKVTSSCEKLPFIIKTFYNSNKFYVNLREEHGYSWNKE